MCCGLLCPAESKHSETELLIASGGRLRQTLFDAAWLREITPYDIPLRGGCLSVALLRVRGRREGATG